MRSLVRISQTRSNPNATVRSRSASRDEDGMSLLELVIAMSVFAIIMLGLAATLATGFTLTRNNRNRSIAANLASQEMDIVRSAAFTSLAASTSTQSVGGVPYTVHRELTWVANNATNGPCDGSNGSPQVLRVHVWVDWPDRKGVATVKADTVLTPPVGAYDPNTGHIAVKVLDRNADAQGGVMVMLSGPSARSAQTNVDGCAFFAFLNAGAYQVSLNTTAYVDRQGYQNPSQNVNVTVGQISSTQFDYDQRAVLDLELKASDSGVIANDLPITLANTILVPSGTRTYAGTGTDRVITNLFPAADGYDAWSGSCADADPEGLDSSGNALYPSAQRAGQLETTPANTTDGDVPLNALEVHVVNTLGVAQSNQTVQITHAADSRCATGETHTYATTDSNGDITLEMPLGTWTIQVQGRTVQGSWPTAVVSPLDTLPRAVVSVAVQ